MVMVIVRVSHLEEDHPEYCEAEAHCELVDGEPGDGEEEYHADDAEDEGGGWTW